MIDLSVSRDKIDEIDSEIVRLFEERITIVSDVAKYKSQTGKAVYDKEREDDKLDRLKKLSHGQFNERAVTELFEQIMSIGRKYQYGVLPHTDPVTDFEKIESFDFSADKNVYYFGVPGSFTQAAMEHIFGDKVSGIPEKTFRGVMEAVADGRAEFGVLPIENSSTGGITANYDIILEYNNAIVGQHVMKIDQCLLGLPGSKVEDISSVYSHPQGLMQCSDFLEKHDSIKGIEFDSTAAAAKKVLNDGDPRQGAIASKRAAKEYGLDVICPDIQNDRYNSTRFIVLGAKEIYTSESDKISLCIELPHKSGSLYRILSHFLYNDLNLTLIESRPIPGKTWEYRFFVDVEGNLSEPAVENALRGIKEEAAFLRVLGNYKNYD